MLTYLYKRREWAAVVAMRPPRKTLREEDFPGAGPCDPPHFIYGWAYDEDYMIAYARQHKLTFVVVPSISARFGGKTEYNYGDLTDEDLTHEPLLLTLRRQSATDALSHFVEHTGASLTVKRPLSPKYKRMVVLWSNYNVEDKFAEYEFLGTWKTVFAFLDNAMNECILSGAERAELQWYWSTENQVVSFLVPFPSAGGALTLRLSQLGSSA